MHEKRRYSPVSRKPLWRRLAWLVGIWLISVSGLGVVAYLLRLFMSLAGLASS
ncbi:DUF2474 domain-containing protein [Azomonas macrocytogenes]|uniref:DUF2474 domain-containing protein n=1 Tax=Azomonas macrocytogenes TaxID=69962 RepID=UPI0016064732|nr:DUF2474 domain-containing protein [Azomonas macrocytogenes]